MKKIFAVIIFLAACSPEKPQHTTELPVHQPAQTDTNTTKEPVVANTPTVVANDTLTAIAQLIAGKQDSGRIFQEVKNSKAFKAFSESFSKRWHVFDSTRVQKLIEFETTTLAKKVAPQPILFYPFSGPDILHASLFFPEAERYVLVALEPVGELPEFTGVQPDSLQKYYKRINSSLHAILNFSFFRTESMSKDLKNQEVDGSIHLLFLFLSRLGHQVVSAKPITIDTLGNKVYLDSFAMLKASKESTKGAEITFLDAKGKVHQLDYFSLNAVDYALKKNKGFMNYLRQMQQFNTYLKGASYLLHKDYFSLVRNKILEGSATIVQDDSGIAYRYFTKPGTAWEFDLYGDYTKPVALFSKQYQKDLDSLYKRQGSSPLGFGLGYNFKDKNSNLMIIHRKNP